jgi:hypothetical protein
MKKKKPLEKVSSKEDAIGPELVKSAPKPKKPLNPGQYMPILIFVAIPVMCAICAFVKFPAATTHNSISTLTMLTTIPASSIYTTTKSTTSTSTTIKPANIARVSYNATSNNFNIHLDGHVLNATNPTANIPFGEYVMTFNQTVGVYFVNWTHAGDTYIYNPNSRSTLISIGGNGTIGLNYCISWNGSPCGSD